MAALANRVIAYSQSVLPSLALILAVSAPLLIAAGAVGCRTGLWDWRVGLLGAVALALALAILAGTISICALVASAMPPVSGRGVFLAGLALLLAAMTIGRIAMTAALGAGLPPINDIRTSESPDLFHNSAPSDPVILSSGKWGGLRRSEAQAVAYPHVAPLLIPLELPDAVSLAERIAERMGWTLDPTEILPDGTTARFTARDVSAWYGFTDDIIVIVRSQNDRSLIGIRSASRVGLSDLGKNAQRIKAFLDDVLLAALRSQNT